MSEIDYRDLPAVEPHERPDVPDHPSQTFLGHHDLCDRSAMLYLKYRAGAGSHPLNRGSVFHEVVAILTRWAIAENERQIPGDVAKTVLAEYLRENPHLQVRAYERDQLRGMIFNWCEASYFDPERIIAVESTLQLEIGGFTLVGRVDLCETVGPRTVQLTDWKTSWAMPDREEFEPQTWDGDGEPRFGGNFQTMTYALLLAFGTFDDGMGLPDTYDRFRLRLAFPHYLTPEGLGERVAEVSRLQLADFRGDVEDQLTRLREVNIGEGKWQPTPGNHCRYCSAEHACPLPRILRPESQHASLETVADLEKAATASWFMAQRATNLKARVKKAAQRIGDENPEALDLGNGDVGVRIGNDLGFVFLHRDSEEIKDKVALRADIEAAVEFGRQFDWGSHFKYRTGTTFEKRRIGPPPKPKQEASE